MKMPGARIPELEKSFCGCSLKTGSKIIAIIFFVFSSFIFTICFARIIVQVYRDKSDVQRDNTDLIRRAILIECALMATLSGLLATLSALLYYGVEKHKASFILPWCILTTAFNAIHLLFIVITFLERFMLLFQCISIFIIATITYAVLIVYSHFRELKRQKNSPTVFTNTE